MAAYAGSMSTLAQDASATRAIPDPVSMGSGAGASAHVTPRGDWVVHRAATLDAETREFLARIGAPGAVTLDLSGVAAIDTTGAYLLSRLARGLGAGGGPVQLVGLDETKRILFDAIAQRTIVVPPRPRQAEGPVALIEETGAITRKIGRDTFDQIAFFGEIMRGFGRVILDPSRMRWTSVIHHVERAGVRSIPIVCLMCFLIGAIVAQQGAFQLRRFGAEAFAAQLVAVLSLRELGVLLAAIMFAGRTGSAFTAELGSMKMREEIDALRVTGLDPIEVLVLPRVLALVIALPIVTILANFAALAGGAVTLWIYAGVEIAAFIDTLQNGIRTVHTFVGVSKAPAMALMIGLVSCYEGLRVQGSAESLGQRVTAAVVTSIFLVIVLDGIFAVVYAAFGA